MSPPPPSSLLRNEIANLPVSDLVRDFGTPTYVYDESQELGRALGATRTPEYYVFDQDRELVYMGLLHDSPASKRRDGTIHYTEGEPTEFYVADAVKALLAGREIPIAETRAHGCSVEYEQD